MAREIQIVGGPRDGEFVEDCGPILREPVARPPRVFFTADEALIPYGAPYEIREYHRETWSDGGDLQPRYVLETTDLGQRSFHPREEI